MVFEPRGYRTERQDLGTSIVSLLVGENQERFVIHEDVICRHSAFFKASVKKEWTKDEERVVLLPEDDPQDIDLYVQWLYKNRILTRRVAELRGKISDEYGVLTNAFIFGEKIQDDLYKDAVIDSLIMATNDADETGSRWFPTGARVEKAYECTPEGSPLRRLLLDIFIKYGQDRWTMPANVDFLTHLAREFFKLRQSPISLDPTDPKKSSCQYHSHAKDQDCYAKNGTTGSR